MAEAKTPLSILIHGDSGVGKSWLAGSVPSPALILDAEGRARYLPYKPKVYWDPTSESPPEAGDWRVCIVQITQYRTFELAYQWLQSGQHPFKSVVIDSLMEMQKRFIDHLVGSNQLQTQDWGEVLRALEGKVREYRDLTITNHTATEVVAITCGTKDQDGRRVPLLQGALRDTLAYYLDAVGYLYVVPTPEGGITRNLLVQPTPSIVAKDGTGLLGGPVIAEPNLSTIHEHLVKETQ